MQYRFQNKKGNITWVDTHAVPLLGNKGLTSGYLGTVSDIRIIKAHKGKIFLESILGQDTSFYISFPKK